MNSPVRAALAVASLALLAACAPDAPNPAGPPPASLSTFNRAGYDQPGAHRQYGVPRKVGDGMARAYVVRDEKSDAPLELGIALDARALGGLPTSGMHEYLLPLPAQAPAPYQLVELDWNPQGHDPAPAYGVPHFDFHFYTISLAERNAIDPSDPQFAAKASNLPVGDYVPPFYVVPGPPAALAVPHMGLHWSDVRSPELQGLLGHPERYQPFTKTFIYGSWNGRFIFYEPMITRAYLRSQPNVVTPIPVPQKYPLPGFYPDSYRVAYDAQAKEYRVALSDLTLQP
ncbi:MAG TPA: DUF5602 domain-containing protein [Gemmatimonadaceae bacterium]|nr:DUF5602 domain-containing protein [Gemmatimonadaceae bacterium]